MILVNKSESIKLLNNNELVIMPTDTVYGIMGKFNKTNEIKINKFKNSDINKKVSVIFYNKKELFEYIEDLNLFKKMFIRFFLPGKYTFIIYLKEKICKCEGFSRTDFGVRITKNKDLQSIIKVTGPLLASSCNKSGQKVCTSLEEIKESFKEENINVFYTENLTNKPSTIYDLTNKKIVKIRL